MDLVLVLKVEDLRTDLLMPRVASINLEKEEKDSFSRNILYSFASHEGKHQQASLRPPNHNKPWISHGISLVVI